MIIKLFAYSNSDTPLLGKCSRTLKQNKYHFDVLLIVINSKSLPVLGLSTSGSLKLLKHISNVRCSDEPFFSEFYDCFGELGTFNNTEHIEIKGNVTPENSC